MLHKSRVGVLISGGLDSTVLLHKLIKEGQDIYPIFINYGQHFYATELASIKAICPENLYSRLKTIDVSSAYQFSESPLIKPKDVWKDEIRDEDLYIPYRTLVMLSVGMAYAQSIGCSKLYAAFIDSNYVKEVDCSTEFFDKLDDVNEMYDGVKLVFPFRDLTKRQVLEYGVSIGAPVIDTYSCQMTKGIPCGVCPNCVDRNNAFREYLDSLP